MDVIDELVCMAVLSRTYLMLIDKIEKASTREDVLIGLGLLQKIRDVDFIAKDCGHTSTILEDIFHMRGDFAPLKKKLEEFNILPRQEVPK